jgi:hypothetical protein
MYQSDILICLEWLFPARGTARLVLGQLIIVQAAKLKI